MVTICGVDGCRGGWVFISKDLETGAISWHSSQSADELLTIRPFPHFIAIDIPIGLPECGPRHCDLEARRLLGRSRSGSVFTAPIRPVMEAVDYRQACQIRLQIEGKQMSWQAWNITHKIREVDELLHSDASLKDIFREVHPEVCFYHMAGGRPMRFSKKSLLGKAERLAVLEPYFGDAIELALAECSRLDCSTDDILDAFAAVWTAERIASGKAVTLPSIPLFDPYGLRMEIIA